MTRLKKRVKMKQVESTASQWKKILEKARKQELKIKASEQFNVKNQMKSNEQEFEKPETSINVQSPQKTKINNKSKKSLQSQKASKQKNDWKKKALAKRFGSYNKEKLYYTVPLNNISL